MSLANRSGQPVSKKSRSSRAGSLASLSAQPGSAEARRMTVTSGLKCLELSENSGPIGCLERMLLTSPVWHSMMRSLTWKVKATPQGRSVFRLAPSMPRTRESESLLWPTPTSTAGDGRSEQSVEMWLARYKRTLEEKGIRNGMPLNVAVKMWLTPSAEDAGRAGSPEWAERWGAGEKVPTCQQRLRTQVLVAEKLWATPTSRDYKDTGDCANVPENALLGRMVHPSKVEGSLNPDWVESLMGFPIGYTDIDGPPLGEQSSTSGSLPA